MLDKFNRYRPVWINVEDLEKEANFLEVFVKAKDYKIMLNRSKINLEPDEIIEVLESDVAFKILEHIVADLEIELYLEKDLTEDVIKKILNLKTKFIDIEADKNFIGVYIVYGIERPTKEKVLDVFNKLYEILYQ
jgi:hypothetical protein